MKTVRINNRTIKLYDSIDEMPIVNYQKYNKYVMFDSSIGSDINDVQIHVKKILALIDSDTVKAKKELENMLQSMFMIANEVSPKYLAFAALIHSIDNEAITDYSDDNLKLILRDLQFTPNAFITKLLNAFKKKISQELELFFPNVFDDAREKEFYDRIRRKAILQLDTVITGDDHSEEIKSIDDANWKYYKPQTFTGKDSIEIVHEKSFESACLTISTELNVDAHKMTVLQFYIALDNIKKQSEAYFKLNKNNGRR